MLATAPAELETAPALGPILQMRAIEKRFPGVHALADVSMEVLPGEVHALVGENGAGKSTLMKILAGVYMPDGGEIVYKGRPYAPRTPRQAINAGIVTIYQELNLVPELTITENMFLGTELHRGPLLEWRAMHGRARELLARLHLEINPRTVISRLGVGQQQMVEVAKALLHEADVIIMDEPTAALSLREIDDLFQIVRELKEHGVSTIFISHHLDEAFALSDRITVLRDGQHVATRATRELTRTELIGLMVGRELAERAPKKPVPPGAEILRVRGPDAPGCLRGRQLHGCAPGRSWAWRDWWGPAGRRSCAPSSGPTRSMPGPSSSMASRSTSGTRATPSTMASPC